MSDTSQGPGWWMASDGKWYPPETWTGPPLPTAMPAGSPMPYGGGPPAAGGPEEAGPGPGGPPNSAAPPFPGAPAQQFGYPPGGGPPSGYQPYGAYPVAAHKNTNGLAVASLVLSCVGIIPFFFGITCILGVIFGFVSRSQIKKTNGTQQGSGLALAGIIVGFGLIGLFVLGVVLVVVFGHNTCNTTNGFTTCTTN